MLGSVVAVNSSTASLGYLIESFRGIDFIGLIRRLIAFLPHWAVSDSIVVYAFSVKCCPS